MGRLALCILWIGSAAACSRVARTSSNEADASLAITIYTAALANGVRTAHAAAPPGVLCVRGSRENTDPAPAVIKALQKDRAILIRPASACRTQPLGGEPRGASLVIDTLTGKRGISIWASEPSVEANGTFAVAVRYYQNGRSGAGWKFERPAYRANCHHFGSWSPFVRTQESRTR